MHLERIDGLAGNSMLDVNYSSLVSIAGSKNLIDSPPYSPAHRMLYVNAPLKLPAATVVPTSMI